VRKALNRIRYFLYERSYIFALFFLNKRIVSEYKDLSFDTNFAQSLVDNERTSDDDG